MHVITDDVVDVCIFCVVGGSGMVKRFGTLGLPESISRNELERKLNDLQNLPPMYEGHCAKSSYEQFGGDCLSPSRRCEVCVSWPLYPTSAIQETPLISCNYVYEGAMHNNEEKEQLQSMLNNHNYPIPT